MILTSNSGYKIQILLVILVNTIAGDCAFSENILCKIYLNVMSSVVNIFSDVPFV